ncbi:MAG: 2-amino-4-hydroxy-6-hydroxymethyldihydropteridine diphosphokinase [Comamonadaceae bacterium]|nr:2-amino-4-hydroxy-6-hydroxymethyldihydropteridine diphosphokinase [Pseudomonadota bacterium]MDE2415562.1 2-amino-4-hydroxy-6-hydroxymethyldihydropteridine diphosphokinase [Comamonadaceae bacterium]
MSRATQAGPPEAGAVSAWIALGANLGDARAALRGALQAMAVLPDTRLLAVSSLYRSAPVDALGPDYLNAVAELQTGLAPLDLLHALQAIEQAAGRERPYRNAPRTLDLDLLLYGEQRLDGAELTVPHPRMWQRAFVLLPLAELRPAWVTPAQLQAVAAQAIERLDAPSAWTR